MTITPNNGDTVKVTYSNGASMIGVVVMDCPIEDKIDVRVGRTRPCGYDVGEIVAVYIDSVTVLRRVK